MTRHDRRSDTQATAGYSRALELGDELRAAESAALAEATRRLVGLAARALDTIAVVMDDEAVPATVRLRAADTVLARLLQLRELVDLEERVMALERGMVG